MNRICISVIITLIYGNIYAKANSLSKSTSKSSFSDVVESASKQINNTAQQHSRIQKQVILIKDILDRIAAIVWISNSNISSSYVITDLPSEKSSAFDRIKNLSNLIANVCVQKTANNTNATNRHMLWAFQNRESLDVDEINKQNDNRETNTKRFVSSDTKNVYQLLNKGLFNISEDLNTIKDLLEQMRIFAKFKIKNKNVNTSQQSGQNYVKDLIKLINQYISEYELIIKMDVNTCIRLGNELFKRDNWLEHADQNNDLKEIFMSYNKALKIWNDVDETGINGTKEALVDVLETKKDKIQQQFIGGQTLFERLTDYKDKLQQLKKDLVDYQKQYKDDISHETEIADTIALLENYINNVMVNIPELRTKSNF